MRYFNLKINKPKFWDSNSFSLAAVSLMPLSIILKLLFMLKKKLTNKISYKIPIICVGNLYLGGTGKTPLVIEIARILKKLKKKPAIIRKNYTDQFDEVELIRKSNKNLFTGRNRQIALKRAISKGLNVAVLDDGYQDHSIKKDLNILCFNSNQLVGNGLTIPSGPLREPLKSVRSSNIVIINGDKNIKFENKVKKFSKNISFYYTKYIPQKISRLKHQKILAFAGIGNPDNFFSLLKKNNLNVRKKISFPDHYIYKQKDIKDLLSISKKKGLRLLTTEKDYFRLKNLGYNNMDYLSVKLKILNELKFIKEIKKYI